MVWCGNAQSFGGIIVGVEIICSILSFDGQIFRPTTSRLNFWFTNILPLVSEIGSPSFRRFIVNLLPWKDVHQIRDIVDYMYDIATGIYEKKKQAFEQGDEAVTQQIGGGNDLISILSKWLGSALDKPSRECHSSEGEYERCG